ncbi:AbrB/MazE/SpoVT family DNA-binding domain-containing protein [Rickettsia endosymbiont of Halotydeus destructor]|uniref:AbrB/MazE/SpoVT family DNA-binding domain-containing protein n=1 Tax=Rickettsia endosymbiont of Halotydeus destructor TaxID=2996754 RepID=UPI003BB06E86
MYINTLTITSQGQISLPKKVREVLNSNIISIEINENNQVILSPISDVGGALAAYKKNSTLSFDEIREKVWHENISQNLKKH